MRTLVLSLIALIWALPVHAQPSIDVSRIYLGLTGAVVRHQTGSGSPEGVVTAPVNSQYIDITTGLKWRKASGSGNTGWTVEISLTPCSTAGQFVRSTGSAWGCSTLVFPNSVAQGELLFGSASNVASALAVGTSGYWLRTQGAGANPAWTAPAAMTKTDDTNVTLTFGGSATTALLNAMSVTVGWTGTLAASRLNANVVQGVTNDTNVTGSISAQNLTFGWSGQLGMSRGGTNASLTAANGGLVYSGSSALAILAPGSSGQIPRSGGAGAPSWSTAAYPSSCSTTGTFLRSDGTNLPCSTLILPNTSTANRVLFSSANNTVSDATAGGMVQSDAGFSAKAYGVPRYGVHLYADAYGSARLDATDSTGHAWIPIEMRGSAVNIRSNATVYGDATIAGNLLPDVANTRSIGSITKPWLTIDVSEFRARTIVAQDVMSTIGGVLNILPTSVLTADVGTGDLSITVKHNLFATGDVVWLQKFGQFEAMRIAGSATGTTGLYIYLVDRNLDASGANAWVTGDGVQNTGTTGDGMIEMYATSGVTSGTVGPTIVGNVRTGTAYNAMAPRWAIGNLNGLYGYSTDTPGVAFGNDAATWVKIDDTNGIRMGFAGTTKVSIHPTTGVASFIGVVADGATLGGFNIGTDYVRDVANTFGLASTVSGSDDVRFWAGAAFASRASAPARITEAGVVTFSSGTIGGWTLGASTLVGGDATLTNTGNAAFGTSNDIVRISADDATYRLWVGHATAASAPFSVTKAGAVSMTSATIVGPDITVGAPTSYSTTGAYKFSRSGNYGQSGDRYAAYALSNSTDQDLYFENTAVGTNAVNANTEVMIRATGWDASAGGGSGAATTAASVRVRSEPSVSDITLNASTIGIVGSLTQNMSIVKASPLFSLVRSATSEYATLGFRTNSTDEWNIHIDATSSPILRFYSASGGGIPVAEMAYDGGLTSYGDFLSTAGSLGGAAPGRRLFLGRNTGGTQGASGHVTFDARDGTDYPLWVDVAGNVRVKSGAAPTADNSVSDTSGTVVGTQSSSLSSKRLIGRVTDGAASLALLLNTPIYDFEPNAFKGEEWRGIVTDYSPAFAMDNGKSFNPASAFGHTVAAIWTLNARDVAMQQEITALRREIAALRLEIR